MLGQCLCARLSRVNPRSPRSSTSLKKLRNPVVRPVPPVSCIPIRPRQTQFRTYCSSSNTQTKKKSKAKLNEALKKLYLKVHPDFFTKHPTEKVQICLDVILTTGGQ